MTSERSQGIGGRVAEAAGDEIDEFVDRSFRRTISRYRRRLRDFFLPSKLHGAYRTARNILSDPAVVSANDDEDLLENAEVIDSEPQSRCGRFCSFLCNLRLELFFFLYTLAYTIQFATSNNLLAVKGCMFVMNQTLETCMDFDSNGKIGTEARKIADLYSIYQSLISFLPGALITLILSSYFDMFQSYKLPLCLSLLGGLLQNIGSLVTSIYLREANMSYNLLCPIPEGIFGGMPAVLMATYTITARSVTKNHRTAKFFTLQMAFMIALPIGKIISALVWRKHGFIPVYSTSVTAQFLAFLWVIFAVKDASSVNTAAEASESPSRHRSRHRYGITSLFSLQALFGTIKSAVERRANSQRIKLWLMIFSIFILVLNSQTSYLSYFYAKKRFNWSFDTYVLVSSGFELASIVILVPIFFLYMHYMPHADLGLAFIGIGSMMARNFLQAGSAATGQSLFYLGYGFGMLSNIAPACIRSHVSRLVLPDEFGRIFGILATAEAVAPLLNRVVLQRLFSLHLFPGFSFLVTALLLVLPLTLLLYLYCKDRRREDVVGEEAAESSDEEILE